MGFVAHDLGVDLGTSNTLVYVKHKGIMISEPTIVVVDAGNERRVRAVGDDAKIMLGRTTEGVMAVRPMREGVITDFDMTEIMIQYFMRKAIGSSYQAPPVFELPVLDFRHRAPRRGRGRQVRRQPKGAAGGKALRRGAGQRAARL